MKANQQQCGKNFKAANACVVARRLRRSIFMPGCKIL
jgi:hypothetical protein